MKKMSITLAVVLALMSTLADARGGSFGGGRSSFSSSRSYSMSSRSYSRPSYTSPSTPRPVINRSTTVNQTVVHQHVSPTVVQQQSSGPGFFSGALMGGGLGYLFGNHNSQPAPVPVVQPQAQFPVCPNPIPVGWNTPCIPSPTQGASK